MRKTINRVLHGINRKYAKPNITIARCLQDHIPSFYDRVPVRLIESTLAYLCGYRNAGDTPRRTQTFEGTLPWTDSDIRISARMVFMDHCFSGNTLCLNYRVEMYKEPSPREMHATVTVILRLNSDRCVPQWLDQCIALESFELRSEQEPDVFLGPVFETALREIFISERDDAHLSRLLLNSTKDQIADAIADMDRQGITYKMTKTQLLAYTERTDV